METGETSDLWWKNAIVYCVDVETYRDANGDGIGDFAGLTVRPCGRFRRIPYRRNERPSSATTTS